MEQNFGKLIRKARKDKGYSQRELSKRLGLDFTYLSKLENDRADYPPKEDVIRSLARNLDLDEEELIFLAGRIPQGDEDFLKEHYKNMPTLFRRMRENPEFAQKVFWEAIQAENRE
ncbi:MAG: helix-turn-helix domain-containing protein [Xenococcaceae cyanobacterium]